MIAVFADEHVEPAHLHVPAAHQPVPPQELQRDQRRLRRVPGPGGDDLAPQVLQGPEAGVLAGDDVGDAVAVGVAHGQRAAPPARAALRVHPGQRRVPRDVDVALEERRDLQLVVRVVDAVDGQPSAAKKSLMMSQMTATFGS